MSGIHQMLFGQGIVSGPNVGDIGHSMRFRAAALPSITRTAPAAVGNQNIWTWSGWFKRGLLNTSVSLFGGEAGANSGTLQINASNQLYYVGLQEGVGGTYGSCQSVAVFRDPTAFLHVVINFDGSRAASDRIRMYSNGVQLATTNPIALAATQYVNAPSAIQAYGIRQYNGPTEYFDGYLARACFVDGQALAPDSFGYFNPQTNEWTTLAQAQVKAVVDAGGPNSSMLDFDDGTSLVTLGLDKSSKGNNWTLNNISITPGTTYDWMLDVPGNSYATLNPLQSSLMNGGSATLADGNLKASDAGSSYGCYGVASMPMSSGKWYWETVLTTAGGTYGGTGIIKTDGVMTPSGNTGYQYSAAATKVSGTTPFSTTTGPAYGATYTAGDVIGHALDLDAGTYEFFKNGVSQGVAFTGITGQYAPAVGDAQNATQYVWNPLFGQAPLHASATYHSAAGGYFRYAPPAGFKALCQRSMPNVAILNPEKHFDVVTWNGATAGTQIDVTGFQYQPDLIWTKARNSTYDNWVQDSVRGIAVGNQNTLSTNTTGAEADTAGLATSWLPNGFRINSSAGSTSAGNTEVTWAWKAGGAAVANNAGSIPSQVSANVEAGFSIVTYTGTGANATVGHGLGRAPGLVVVKQRSSGTTENWAVWHSTLANTEYLLLNGTAAKATGATYWNSTTPTTTVFSVGSAADTNESAKDFVAYCFAEIPGFSKIFSYTGNGNADGPFVNCGFKPKYVLIKAISAAGSWDIVDAVRDTYNVTSKELYPNTSGAEGANTFADFVSNGFKLRWTNSWANASGVTYVGIAFADVPGKYSLAR